MHAWLSPFKGLEIEACLLSLAHHCKPLRKASAKANPGMPRRPLQIDDTPKTSGGHGTSRSSDQKWMPPTALSRANRAMTRASSSVKTLATTSRSEERRVGKECR